VVHRTADVVVPLVDEGAGRLGQREEEDMAQGNGGGLA